MRPEHWLFTIPLRLRALFRRVAKGLDAYWRHVIADPNWDQA